MIKKHEKLKKSILIVSIILTFLFFVLSILFYIAYKKNSLDIEKLTSLNNGIVVYSATGNENTLYNTNRSIIDISTLPEYVKKAFVDIEDKRFYKHNGYDLKRILKAAMVNMVSKSKTQGASTISQQLIKNTLLNNKKTYSRKIKEIILASKMERKFSKDEILEMYLNTIYFGSNAYGIENASRIYFDKSAKDLTINEACCLAGIIKSPNYYSPKINPINANKRKNVVAKAMLKCKDITKEEYTNILNEDIITASNTSFDNAYEEEAIYEACSLLNLTEREIINNKYQIITFKDDDLQNNIIEINSKIINENKENSSLDSLSVVADEFGHVIAYYANSNYNLHSIKRQPASTLKPLAVYLPCIVHNILKPANQILDDEINFNGFAPNNADKQFHGYVSTRKALADSLNVPAVKALDYVGLKKSKEILEKLGINITNSDMNLSLALGSTKYGVKLLDLLSAYVTIQNYGYSTPLTFVDKILDSNGNIIYINENYKEKVLDEKDCFLLTDMLKDCAKYGTAKRLNELNLPVASKTGTANNGKTNTDVYNIAYTTKHSMLTWIANIKDNKLNPNIHSSNQPTEINKRILNYIYKNTPSTDFAIPEGIEKMPYDLIEMELNHTLIAPSNIAERYIAYDYFKSDYPPNEATNAIFQITTKLDKSGATLNFIAKKNLVYNIYRKTTDKFEIIEQIKETAGNVEICDKNIFKYNEVKYYILDSNNEIIAETNTIRPKDYLINRLNNEILINKKKWLV